MDRAINIERLGWEIKRALYSFRRGPALAVCLLQIPVLAFVYLKGAGPVYLDMVPTLLFIIMASWFLTSVVHGNVKIWLYVQILLTVGTMLQCIFLEEAMLKNPERFGEGTAAAGLQIQYLLGFFAAVAASFLYYRWAGISSVRTCRILFLISSGISVLTLLFAASVGGVKNWIRIGGLSVQTTEITKLIYLFMAACLLGNQEVPSRKRIRDFCLISALQGLFLILQNEYGTLLLLILVFFAFLFLFVPETACFLKVSGVCSGFLLAGVLTGFGVSRLAVRYRRIAEYRLTQGILKVWEKIANRFIYWLHPEKDPLGLGYQLLKARDSILLGGWFGTSHITEIPVKTSDLVYPALIGRCGMVFALLVFFIYIMMWLEGMRLFVRKSDRYHQAAAAGIVIMFFLQTIIIIAGSTGLCPLTGITLPFISSGGTSLLVCFVMAGILITISGNVGWKGTDNEKTEEFFKESPVIAKCLAGIRDFNHTVIGPNLRNLTRHFPGSRPAEGESKTGHV